MNIELPRDAEGREIQLDTRVLYDENGKKLHITSFTYKCDIFGLWSKWKVFSHDIKCDDGMLPADSLYLTPPDSWNKCLMTWKGRCTRQTLVHMIHLCAAISIASTRIVMNVSVSIAYAERHATTLHGWILLRESIS